MQLNLQKLLPNDEIGNIVDKLNINFEQIVLNGGGPRGFNGIIGPPGIPGRQGLQGAQGALGARGNSIFATSDVKLSGNTVDQDRLDSNVENYQFGNTYGAINGDTFVTSSNGSIKFFKYIVTLGSPNTAKFEEISGSSSQTDAWFQENLGTLNILRNNISSNSPRGIFAGDTSYIIPNLVKGFIENGGGLTRDFNNAATPFGGLFTNSIGVLHTQGSTSEAYATALLIKKDAGTSNDFLITLQDAGIKSSLDTRGKILIDANNVSHATDKKFLQGNIFGKSLIFHNNVSLNITVNSDAFIPALSVGGTTIISSNLNDSTSITTDVPNSLGVLGNVAIGSNKLSLGKLSLVHNGAVPSVFNVNRVTSTSTLTTYTNKNIFGLNSNALADTNYFDKNAGFAIEENSVQYSLNNAAITAATSTINTKFISKLITPESSLQTSYIAGAGYVSTTKTVSKVYDGNSGALPVSTNNIFAARLGLNTTSPVGQLTLGSILDSYGSPMVIENRSFADGPGNRFSTFDSIISNNLVPDAQDGIFNRPISYAPSSKYASNAILSVFGNFYFPSLGAGGIGSASISDLKFTSKLTLRTNGRVSIGQTFTGGTRDFADTPRNLLHIGDYFTFSDGREYTSKTPFIGYNLFSNGTNYLRSNYSEISKGLMYDNTNNAIHFSTFSGSSNLSERKNISVFDSGADTAAPKVYIGAQGNDPVYTVARRRGTLNIRGTFASTSTPTLGDIYNLGFSEAGPNGRDLIGIGSYAGYIGTGTTNGSKSITGTNTPIVWTRIDDVLSKTSVNPNESSSLFSIGKMGDTDTLLVSGRDNARLILGRSSSVLSGGASIDDLNDMYKDSTSILNSWKSLGRVYLHSPYLDANINTANGGSDSFKNINNIVSREGSILLITDPTKIEDAAWSPTINFPANVSKYASKIGFATTSEDGNLLNKDLTKPNIEITFLPAREDSNSTTNKFLPETLVIQRTEYNRINKNGVRTDIGKFMSFQSADSANLLDANTTTIHTRLLLEDGIGLENVTGGFIKVHQPLKVYPRNSTPRNLLNYDSVVTSDTTYSPPVFSGNLTAGVLGRGYAVGGGNAAYSGSDSSIQAAIVSYGRIVCNHEIMSLSDKTVKNHIEYLDSARSLHSINLLKGAFYEFKNSLGEISTGFYAQDVKEAVPFAVNKHNDEDASEEEQGLLNLNYNAVFVHGIAAIQELSKLNDEKDRKILELEERLSRLEKLLLNDN